jgi:nucleotide-binding universal stress UspA family protein
MDLTPLRRGYTFWWSVILGFLIIHLIGIYIYSGGKYIGLPGGSVSIGIVSKAPNIIDPLGYGLSKNTDLVLRFLFRSMVRYNASKWLLEGDIANCDLANLARVSCRIKENITWSDGTRIQPIDVISTFQAFRTSQWSTRVGRFLGGVSVIEENGNIIFEARERNPLMIDLLLYPVIRSDMLEQIKTGRFLTGSYVSSGPYTFAEVGSDSEYGFDRITLAKNLKYSGNIPWIDKLSFKFFATSQSLERSADTLGLIIPPSQTVALTLTDRFREYLYTSHEFFGIFFHTDRLDRNMREALHWQLGTTLSGVVDTWHSPIGSLFVQGGPMIKVGAQKKSFADMIRASGYIKKDEKLAQLDKISTTVGGEVTYEAPKFFQKKDNSLVLYLSDADKWITLYGKVPTTVNSVAINGKELKEYIPGKWIFIYTIARDRENLNEWENLYSLTLTTGSGLALTGETIRAYYSTNSGTLAGYRSKVESEYISRKNTPALIAERQRKKDEAKKQVEALVEGFYYNTKNEPFSLKVVSVSGPQGTEYYGERIEKALKDLGIKTDRTILEPKDIATMIQTGKKDYDIIVIGAENPGGISQLGQIFLSSEAGKGINFANIESKTLDTLFAELRGTTDETKLQAIQKKITESMQTESFFLPLARPYHRLYTDRNLKW